MGSSVQSMFAWIIQMEARQALILKLKMTWYSINWNNWWRSKKKTKMKTNHDQETVKFWLLLFSFKKWIESAQLCPTLCDPMDCSPPGSSVHGILQARILEWVAVPFSRGSFQPRDRTQVSNNAGGFFTSWATREARLCIYLHPSTHPFIHPSIHTVMEYTDKYLIMNCLKKKELCSPISVVWMLPPIRLHWTWG